MSYPFTLFTRPHGNSSEHEMRSILPADEVFLREHDVKISMEDCGPFITIWADDGTMMDDDPTTPDEITYIVGTNETCEQAMTAICERVRLRKGIAG